MAQHPDKLRWKDDHPYGLSASQFGMALGFCGRISDYVHYLRHIVGTEKEFKGNEFTAHGINTEPKSRALYELLTGCQVHNGGFFVTADRILGCSPDGQIFYPADEKPLEQQGPLMTFGSTPAAAGHSSPTLLDGDDAPRRSSGCSVRVPFKSKRRARSPLSASNRSSTASPIGVAVGSSTDLQGPTTGADTGASSAMEMHTSSLKVESPLSLLTSHFESSRALSASSPTSPAQGYKVRLLEIKSPYRALYDSTKPGYEPFGIPLHYMCQLQGQMAIADCEECDFFVYLDHPVCQVEGWRVRRSRAFWNWAEPALRQVSSWVKDGPPDWLNRTFAFPPFDFHRIEVIPLVFPYDITAGAPLKDARRFSYFAKYPSPYEALTRHREARSGGPFGGGGGLITETAVDVQEPSHDIHGYSHVASQTQRHVQQWCSKYCGGTSWADLTEYERIALAVQTPVVRFLFEANGGVVEQERCQPEKREAVIASFCQTLSSWRRLLEAAGCYAESSTAQLWRSLLRTASAGRDPLVQLDVAIPEDWEEGRIAVSCSVPAFEAFTLSTAYECDTFADATSLGFFQRLFLISLVPAPDRERTNEGSSAPASQPPSQCSITATPLDSVPVFHSKPVKSLQHSSQRSPPSQRTRL